MSNPAYCWLVPFYTSLVLFVLFLKLSEHLSDMIGRSPIHISSTDKTEFSHRIINFNRQVTQKELCNIREFYLCFCSGGSLFLLIYDQHYQVCNLRLNCSMHFRSHLISHKRTREKKQFCTEPKWWVPFFSEDLLTLFLIPLISSQ